MTTGIAGLKMWIQTLVSYDAFGNATVEKSFTYPAADSSIKYPPKKRKVVAAKPAAKEKRTVQKSEEEIDLWNQ